MSRTWRAHLYILPIISFSIIYNLPKFFELEVTSKVADNNATNRNDTKDLLIPLATDRELNQSYIVSFLNLFIIFLTFKDCVFKEKSKGNYFNQMFYRLKRLQRPRLDLILFTSKYTLSILTFLSMVSSLSSSSYSSISPSTDRLAAR